MRTPLLSLSETAVAPKVYDARLSIETFAPCAVDGAFVFGGQSDRLRCQTLGPWARCHSSGSSATYDRHACATLWLFAPSRYKTLLTGVVSEAQSLSNQAISISLGRLRHWLSDTR